ncbi:uncharacterized protein LOC100175530 isoform X2 [Ciona intestinalis]
MSTPPISQGDQVKKYNDLTEKLKELTVASSNTDDTENLKDIESDKGKNGNLDIEMQLRQSEDPSREEAISLDEELETDDESEEEDSSDEDDEPIRAPVELLGEFLQYIRQGKWEDAKKLCVMILIYEPNNSEALQFQPVIDAKIQIEKELAEMSDSSSEEESDESSEEEDSEEGEESTEEEDSDEEEIDRRSHLHNKLLLPSDKTDLGVWRP